ncbi:uncharacterized protein LOC126742696 [Anthonomus grandis grandis]|uniref:uncharacterized protein LOC126742696 n=1 Tax=Anthonomus grandis grandis TaxID=2921223 RepID=UPI002165310C|nr:uncharacterized protein LOC126742696 [Anthonomus grandis grandis]
MTENVIKGYLDVKISSKSRRGFRPWKAWRRHWCEIQRTDDLDIGVELKLKSSEDGNTVSCIRVPRSAILCRTDSRTKQFAFGVLNLRNSKKAVLFLAGCSESDTQEWMFSIRKMLSIATQIPVGESNFTISLVDTDHSRSAGLVGLYGVLHTNASEIVISDPCTGTPKIVWTWYHFHQFHLQATCLQTDDKKIVVMHTSSEFLSGPGQLLLYCREGPSLLHHLITRGQRARFSSGLLAAKRFSRSEGYLCESRTSIPDSPLCFRSQAGSDDSGVQNSNISDEGEYARKSKTNTTLASLELTEITKTPGGSETEDSCTDLQEIKPNTSEAIPRNESGISLASGIYEEIPENHQTTVKKDENVLTDLKYQSHIYENPLDLIISEKFGKYFTAPPLPPRTFTSFTLQRPGKPKLETPSSPCKPRCLTLPAKDLSKISQMFNSGHKTCRYGAESEYVVMNTPTKTADATKKTVSESIYVPMTSPVIQLKNKIIEGVYMSMTGNGKKTA